jgi:hypothetical protein
MSASTYCKKELDIFYKKTQNEKAGIKVGERSRIVHVLLNNINRKQWPVRIKRYKRLSFSRCKEPSDFGDTIDTLSPEFRPKCKT